MTGPEQAPAPSVATAPAEGASSSTGSPRAPLIRRRLPAHLGPARTSTVLLAVAFIAIGVLYLFVKPPEDRTAGIVGDPTPATSRSAVPTTSAPAPGTTTAPEETAAPTSEVAPPPTEAPDEGTAEETQVPTTAEVPTTEDPTTAPEETAPAPGTSAALPTTAAPSP